jgi:hypothetical protein
MISFRANSSGGWVRLEPVPRGERTERRASAVWTMKRVTTCRMVILASASYEMSVQCSWQR